MKTVRLDYFLYTNKFVSSRTKAQELIKSKFVNVNGVCITKANYQITPQDCVEITNNKLYVSRAANKLKCAIDTFKINLKNKAVLDIGSSTGGFTQICLINKASKIYAVDVGTNQMNKIISSDPKVVLFENTDFRNVDISMFKEKIDFVCCDVSFISLTKIIDKLCELFSYGYEAVFLIKPQFEIQEFKIKNFKGVVKDENIRNKVVNTISSYLSKRNFSIKQIIQSPIKGKEGNIEYLIYVSK